MSKELWVKAKVKFIGDHDREPTDDEMITAYADLVSSIEDGVREKEENSQ